MDTNHNPGSENPTNEENGAVRRLLDDAARAYMDGDYQAAVGAWQSVLDVDPSNPRAREGIKKVSMLQADDGGAGEQPFEPAVEEIEDLLKRRQFDAALQACQRHAEGAGPALNRTLRLLQQKAETARAVEPEIKRCMASARRSLQAGQVSEALPHLKQVLTLDRSHPVASRLMEGLRQRVKQREQGKVEEPQALPASGQPGSDAPLAALEHGDAEPAPLGQGLPSSPVGEGADPTSPEIELDMVDLNSGLEGDGGETLEAGPLAINLESEEPALDLADMGTAATEPASDEATAEGAGRHAAAAESLSESPFAMGSGEPEVPATEPAMDAGPEPQGSSALHVDEAVPLAGGDMVSDSPSPFPGEDAAESEAVSIKPVIPRSVPDAGKGRGLTRYLALAALLILAAAVAAWQLDLLPSGQQDFGVTVPANVQPAPVAEPAGEDAGDAGTVNANPAPGIESAATSPAQPAAVEQEKPRQALLLLEQGQDAFQAGRLEEAAASFREAQKLDPVNRDIQIWMERTTSASQQVMRQDAALAAAVTAFEAKDYATALRRFYRLQEGGASGDFNRFIANSWYNWGLELLAAGNLREASLKMDEVLAVDPADTDAQAIQALVNDYARRAKDRAFYTQLEALRYRQLDD